jgi:DNA polymerase-1
LKVCIDIEANGLVNPDKIWVVVCKDIETNQYRIFRDLEKDDNKRELRDFLLRCELLIGHNYLSYDGVHLERIIGHKLEVEKVIDTLIISKLVDYPRQGHSVEDYGEEFGFPKGIPLEDGTVIEARHLPISFYMKYSKDLERYCIRDVDITHKIYLKYLRYISVKEHQRSILLEHRFQLVTNELSNNGFYINLSKAKILLDKVTKELSILDKDILDSFRPKLKLIREITPRSTKYGTISLTSIPKTMRDKVSELTVDAPFSYCTWTEFNPSSHSQIIKVLNEAGWKPIDKTKTHIDSEREFARLKHSRKTPELDLKRKELYTKLEGLKKTGWKVNENNLETLPPSAPSSARLLAKRILLEARRRTLTEWIELVQDDGRIHGKFYAIGAWTHRMAHQAPNTANIPNEFDTSGKKKLYGKELRSLWCAPKNRLLVGVDAEGIQLRIFAHYINDPEFTDALVKGRKDDKTDPHSLNQRILGDVCKSRAAAKRFIYALLLGAGLGKLSEILGCSSSETQQALDRLLSRYTGWATLKEEVFPKDARRGWFIGLDERKVIIPGGTESSRRHLAMSGYLQNGEAVVMKSATLKWWQKLEDYDAKLVNFVHDEWQTECPNNVETALKIAKMQADSLEEVGRDLGLLCPLAGSYWNDDTKDFTIDTNWSKTH